MAGGVFISSRSKDRRKGMAMDNTNGYSLSDLAAATNGGCNNWGNDWMGMFFIFALLCGFGNGGFGFGGNGFANAIGYENLATSAEVQRGFDNQNSMANQREILATSNANALQEMQNNNQNTQYLMTAFNDKYNELQRDIAGVSMGVQQSIYNQQQCCCDVRSAIQEAAAQQRYDSAMQFAQTQQLVQAEGAATRSMIQQYRYDDLLQRYNQLDQRMNTQELRNDINAATANVVRYPNGFVYNAGPSPFCGCANGYNI